MDLSQDPTFNAKAVRILFDSLGRRHRVRMTGIEMIELEYVRWCADQLVYRISGQSKLIVAALLDGRHYADIATDLGYSEKWLKGHVRGFIVEQMRTMFTYSMAQGLDLSYRAYVQAHFTDPKPITVG